MTDGHIVTIVQNLIMGHGSLFRTAGTVPVILIHSLRFLPSCLADILRRVWSKFDGDNQPVHIELNNSIERKDSYLGTDRTTKKREEKQEKRHLEGSAKAFFR